MQTNETFNEVSDMVPVVFQCFIPSVFVLLYYPWQVVTMRSPHGQWCRNPQSWVIFAAKSLGDPSPYPGDKKIRGNWWISTVQWSTVWWWGFQIEVLQRYHNVYWLVVWLPSILFSQKYWGHVKSSLNWRSPSFFRGVAEPPTRWWSMVHPADATGSKCFSFKKYGVRMIRVVFRLGGLWEFHIIQARFDLMMISTICWMFFWAEITNELDTCFKHLRCTTWDGLVWCHAQPLHVTLWRCIMMHYVGFILKHT